jgi:thymidylate synthase
MNLEFIKATTISDSWFLCLNKIFEVGREYIIDRGSYIGQKRLEFDYITIHIKYPNVRPLLPECSISSGIPNPASNEYLEEYLPYLMTSAKKPNELYTYGIDVEPQMKEIIKMFKDGGSNTNQACITIGDANSIKLDDPQCLKVLDFRVSNNKLHVVIYFRSNDLWGGYPVNIASIQILKEYVADEVGAIILFIIYQKH